MNLVKHFTGLLKPQEFFIFARVAEKNASCVFRDSMTNKEMTWASLN